MSTIIKGFSGVLFAILLIAGLTTTLVAQPSGYLFYKVVTVNGSQVQGTNTNFPVLVRITDPNLVANARSDGFDIVFTSAFGSTTILDHQLESYNSATGELVAWVKLPSVSSTGNTFYMWYGNSSVTTNQSSNATWSNQFRSVYHLGNSFNDASPNGKNGTNFGTTAVTGLIGGARNFDGDNDYIALNDSYSSTGNQQVTVSAWIKTSDSGNQIIASFDRNEYWRLEINGSGAGPGEVGWDLLTSAGQLDFGSNATVNSNTWRHIVGVYNAGTTRIFIDGVQNVSFTQGTSFGTGNTRFGFIGVGSEASTFNSNQGPSDNFNGDIDELRISNVARTANWIQTEFNNQKTPSTFLSFGSQLAVDQTAPTLQLATVNSTTIALDYDENLDATSVPATGNFVVNVNASPVTINNVSISNDSVLVTLANAVNPGDVVTINYTAGSNPIRDISLNNSANLSGQNVANNAGSTLPSPPIVLAATAVANGNIAITFDDVDATSVIQTYTIKRGTAQGGPYSTIGTVTDNESSSYTFTDTNANNGTTYFYVLTSTDQNSDESLDSEEISATSDNVNPVLQLASVNGETVILDYNELMDINSVPATGDFVVRVNGGSRTITDVQVSGPRVILTLDPEAQSGDVVEVDYTIGINPIRDAASNQASAFTNQSTTNNTFSSGNFGPDPCPITNSKDAAWACFSGIFNGTSLTANIGGLTIATIAAATGSQTTFAPNSIQSWASGAFSGDQFNGPQVNPVGTAGNATSFDINIPSGIPSDALILSLNRLRPTTGAGTTYTLEAFDAFNQKIAIDDWATGQGTDGGVCTNSVNLNYTNGNTTIEFQPTISGNQACNASSTPIWFRITDANVSRIELRKIVAGSDNIHFGLAVVADFGDAPSTFGTRYSGSGTPPAFHLLNNGSPNTVYLGAGVDADGNGLNGTAANGDDTEINTFGGGDDEDGISVLADITTAQNSYSTTLVCTNGANIGGWIDFNQSGTFDANEFANGLCASGSTTLTWSGLNGLVTGTTYARFRIASALASVSNPTGFAVDGEVEDYQVSIIPPPLPDLDLTKVVDNSSPVVGDNVTFTLTLTNPGEFDATGIRVTDQLPAGLTFVSATASQGFYNASSGVWNIGTISDGDSTSVTLNLSATVNGGTLGNTIVNTAEITRLNEVDPELGNNSASAGITVVPESADIGISKIVDDNQPIEAQTITFTVIVANNGPKAATNIVITDQIPSGLTFVSATPSVGTYSNTTGIWNIPTLANGAQATMAVVTTVNVGTVGSTITNAADLTSFDQVDPVATNNTGSVDVDVVPAGFPQSCSALPYPKFNGNSLLSGTAGQVGAIYLFEDVTTGIDAEIEILAINNAVLNAFDATVTGAINNFQPEIRVVDDTQDNGYIDFEIRFLEANTQNPKFLNFAASAIDVDGNGLKEFVGFQRLTSFTVEQSTNLIIDNFGIYTTFEASGTSEINGIDTTSTEYLTYTTYTNEPKFRYRAGIKDPANTTRRQFSLSFSPCIINGFTNPVSTNIIDLGISKTVDDNVPSEGDNIEFSIEVSNLQGNVVGNVEVTDQLPNEVTYVSASASQGSYNNTTGIWDVGSLAGAQTATLTIQATVDNNTAGDSFTNTATITNFTGTDGNVSNNSAFVNLLVNDPQSTSCSVPPTFSFINNNLEQGVPSQVNAVYRFTNVASGVDALVQIIGITNATVDDIDDNTLANSTSNFSPLFTALQGGGFVDWEIKFVAAGTTMPVKRDFALTGLDIDGFVYGDGTVRDYLGFSQNQGYIVQAGNNLEETAAGPFQIFRSSTTTDGNGSFDIDHMAYILYNYTSVFRIRTGTTSTGTTVDDRLVDIDFTPCRNQDFTNPVTVTRDADIGVTKTVDVANPLVNGTVNFTISVANNGPETVTELDINENLPDGLTLVQSTPSQGTYSQITNLWAVGTLTNGSSATLQIEATVNSNIQQDSLINKAFVQGLNQVDPNINNDTSSVVLKIGVELKGTIFEDITGNGFSEDVNFSDASGDQQALENVEVHLFKDGGDGLANGSDDTFISTTLSSNVGAYTFQVGDDGDYWVVVDSKTGELSNGSTWGEQTYGPIGGVCEDGSGSQVIKTTAGQCFGGRRGDQSDNISATPLITDLPNAEHLAKVTVSGATVIGIDFGFSFNVVTNVDDGDDDGSSNRTIQGSLRQFIINANEITGANSMRFVPAVPTNATGSGGNWWSVNLTSSLPTMINPLTTIAGTAYLNTAPKTTRDDNPGFTGTGGSVGVDNLSLNTFSRKEFEVNGNDVGSYAFLVNSSGAFTIRNIAVYNATTAVQVSSASGGLIEKNLIGTRADGTDPSGANRNANGLSFTGSGAANTLVQENYVAFSAENGIRSTNSSASLNIFKNEVYRNGLNNTEADGISGLAIWTIQQNLIWENGNSSSSAINGGSGLELGSNSGTSANGTVRNNTIRNNAVSGITTLNSVTNTLIEKNAIFQNGTNYTSASTKEGAGIKLTSPNAVAQQGVRITRNSFYENYGIAVDIVNSGSGAANGVNPNDGLLVSSSTTPNRGIDYPVFTLTTLENNILHIEGYVGTNATKLPQSFTIEVYKAADDGDSNALIEVGGTLVRPHGEGKEFLGVITTNTNGTFNADIDVSGGPAIAFNDRITAIAISAANNTSEFSANQRVVPTGVTISGFVYHDINHNEVKDPTESGIENVTIVLYNTQQNNCKSVLTDSQGFYQFTNVLNGTYDLIEAFGQSVPTPDVCTPAAVDPDDFISTTPNLRTVNVNNLPAVQNFGDFEGAKITGTVFNDNGTNSGTANDGLQNGGEAGISTQVVKVLTASDVLIEQTSSGADGTYTLFVPKSVVPSGGTVKIEEINGAAYLSTGGDAGTTNGSYAIATDRSTFTIQSGTVYTDVDFADVQISVLQTDGTQTTQPGAVAVFTHLFDANTAGDVTFTTSSVNNPNITFPVILNRDLNCNGSIDSGEPILSPTTTISVLAGQDICLVVRVNVPNGVNDGGTSTTTVTATFDYANSPTNIQQILQRTDVVTVSTQEGGLVIIKAVDKAQALPGDTLTYSINYENLGDEPISQVEVIDEVPVFTTFASAVCGSLPTGITNCSITTPNTGVRGTIRWIFTGTLQPGESGTVSYKVLIDD